LCRQFRRAGHRVGFIPTMGSLHAGHLALIRKARETADRVVVSIFVNPLQFGPKEDFGKYPRPVTEDVETCREAGVDLVFHPEVGEIYPEGFSTAVVVETLTEEMCGRSRPGHFRGVTTVVAKLLNIVLPDVAVFGQKDAQQAVVVRRMIRDLNMATELVVIPTVREADGLAVSSRNQYLTDKERAAATVLHRSLQRAEEMLRAGERSAGKIEAEIRNVLQSQPLAREEYISLTDAGDLRPLKTLKGRVLIALAVMIGKTRLIDNVTIDTTEKEE
jgi:pantoate--beta-alanine ligase